MKKRTTHNAQRKTNKVGLMLFSLGLALCVLRFAFPCFAEEKIIAVVNNEIVTQKDLDDFLNFMRIQYSQEYSGQELETKVQSMKVDLLDKLIEDRLILQEAKKNDSIFEIAPKQFVSLKPDENRVRAKIEGMKSRYGSDKEFQRILARDGLSQADVEKRVREQLLMRNIVEVKVRVKAKVNPAEVTEYYRKNMEQFKIGELREFEVIGVKERSAADDICGMLRQGKPIEELIDKDSATVNRITAARDGSLRKDIEEEVFKLQIGEVSKPISLEDKFYIFQLKGAIPPRQQLLNEARDKIYAYLYERKMQEGLDKWLDEVKKRSYIKVIGN